MRKIILVAIMLISTGIYSHAQFMPFIPYVPFVPSMPYNPYMQSQAMINAQMSAMELMNSIQRDIDQIEERALRQTIEDRDNFFANYERTHPNATDAEATEAYGRHVQAMCNAQNAYSSGSSYSTSSSTTSSSSSTSAGTTQSRRGCKVCKVAGNDYMAGNGKCRICGGSGLQDEGFGLDRMKCAACGGSGKCTSCNGTGYR